MSHKFQFQIKTWVRLAIATIIFILAVPFLSRMYIIQSSADDIYTVADSPSASTALVFGAGLRRDGRPTSVLRDRVTTAVEIYISGKVNYLLMSGQAPEPTAMRDFALSLGVPDNAILLDNGGFRTYDSCFNASENDQFESVILVTQEFHLPRAVFLCEALGVDSYGVVADNLYFGQRTLVFWNLRETFASFVAIWDLYVDNPRP